MKLPEIQPRGVVTRAPQSSVSPADVANPYLQVAAAFDAWGETLNAKAMDDARIEGQAAVHADDSGNLTVDLRSNMSEKGRLYNRMATQSLVAQLAPQIRTAAAQQARDANGNPETFRASWKAYADQMMANAPSKELRGPIRSLLDATGVLQHEGVVDQRFKIDTQNAKSALSSEREYLMNSAASLAMQGGIDTPSFKSAVEKIHSLNAELTGNPVFGYSTREAEIDMRRFSGRMRAESLVGEVDRAADGGGIAEAVKLRDRFLSDTTLEMSPQERRTYYGIANARIEGITAQQRADVKVLQTTKTTMVKDIEAGTLDVNSPNIDALGQQLAKAGDVAGSLELQKARRMKVFADGKNAEQVAMAERSMSEANRPAPGRSRPISVAPQLSGRMEQAMKHYIARGLSPVMAAGIVGNLVQESGLNTSARNKGDGRDGSDSIGLGQWNGDRSRALQAFAQSRGASPDDYATQLDFVLHELETTEGVSYQRLKAAKNVDEATAAMIGFERPAGWSDANPRGGHGWDNRLAMALKAGEMQGLTGEELAVSKPFPVSADEAKAWSTEFTKDVRATIPDLEAGIKSGVPFDRDSLNLLTRQLVFVDQDLREEVATLLEKNAVILGAQSASPEEIEAAVGTLRSDMAETGATAAQLHLAEGLDTMLEAKQKALKTDPIGYGISQGLVRDQPPLDLNNIGSYGPTLQRYQQAASIMEATGQASGVSAFRPAQEEAIARLWQNGDPRQLSALGDALSSLRPETLKATIASDGYKAALTGAILSNDPIRHGEAMKQLDLYSEVAGWPEFEGKFTPDIATRLQEWQSKTRYMSLDEATEWLQQRNAPDYGQRIRPLVTEGQTEARKVSFNSLMESIDGGMFADPAAPVDPSIREEALRDFASLTGMLNGALGDTKKAKEEAIKRMKDGKWGSSSVFGETVRGRFMLYPPERFYDPVEGSSGAGSHKWMHDELADAANGLGVPVENLSLISDSVTEMEVQRGERNRVSYAVSVVDPKTGFANLVTDDQGMTQRFRFDRASAISRQTQRAEDMVRQRPQSSQTGFRTSQQSASPSFPVTITDDRSAIGRQFGIEDRQGGPTIEGIRKGVGDALDTMMLKNTPKPSRKRGE